MQSNGQAPQGQILAMIAGYWQANALATATQLGLADLLAEKPLSVKELAQRAGANAAALFQMLRALESEGIFKQVSPHVFANSAVSELLRKDIPGSQAAGILHTLGKGGGCYEAWHEFEHAVRTGESGVEKVYGHGYWEYLKRNPQANEWMNEAMRAMSSAMTPAVTAAYDWRRFSLIADIGGGIGTQITSILDASPSSEGVLFDQPHVVADSIPHDRLQVVGGSFFESAPTDADAYLLRFVLHDWPDEEAEAILRCVRRSMKPSATLILAELLVSEKPGPDFNKWTDLHMLAMCRGKERTSTEFREMLAKTGFELAEVIPTGSQITLVIAQPVGDADNSHRSYGGENKLTTA